jgi:hypothetical protein
MAPRSGPSLTVHPIPCTLKISTTTIVMKLLIEKIKFQCGIVETGLENAKIPFVIVSEKLWWFCCGVEIRDFDVGVHGITFIASLNVAQQDTIVWRDAV